MKHLSPASFWRQQKNHYRLVGHECSSCFSVSYPGRNECMNCKSSNFKEVLLSGKGKLITWTINKAAPVGFEAPYTIGVIQLAEGPFFTAQIIGPEVALKQNAPVRQVFRRLMETEDHLLVYGTKFELVEE